MGHNAVGMMRRLGLYATVLLSAAPALAAGAMPEGFVHLRKVAPDIVQDMRYAGRDNFTGEVVPGYLAPECILVRPAAEALARVQADLEADGLSLVVFDCFRPGRAVAHFVDWVQAGGNSLDPRYYPNTPRDKLIEQGYIAARSGHSTGGTVDLAFGRKREDGSVEIADLGDYDLLDPASHTASDAVSGEKQRNRQRLVQAMARHGFVNYDKEWWHYTYADQPYPGQVFDFPVDSASD